MLKILVILFGIYWIVGIIITWTFVKHSKAWKEEDVSKMTKLIWFVQISLQALPVYVKGFFEGAVEKYKEVITKLENGENV